ncbi:MAG: TIR domain-containing protein [Acidobacteriota bacterium]
MANLLLKIFVASPGDVSAERDIVSFVVDELRRTIGNIRKVELETVRWETHSWPDVGSDAQDVINSQIGEYDVLVGVMWKRFGTPTKRSKSGTEEEFERAYQLFKDFGRPKIMFYFRTTPFYSTDREELSQFRKVIAFRKKLEKLGVLFWQYDQPLTFERDVREHLMRRVLELTEPKTPPKIVGLPRIFISSAREDVDRVSPVYKALVAAGFNPWMDIQDLLPGQDWVAEIQKTISHAHFFLFFISEASVSKRGYLHKEISAAIRVLSKRHDGEPYIIPVRLDAVEPPRELMQYHWVDLFSSDGMEKLILALKAAWQAT